MSSFNLEECKNCKFLGKPSVCPYYVELSIYLLERYTNRAWNNEGITPIELFIKHRYEINKAYSSLRKETIDEQYTKDSQMEMEYDYRQIRLFATKLFRYGYHIPEHSGCTCTPITSSGGAYRDEVWYIESSQTIVFYLHQHPILVITPNCIKISTCGYRTKTTQDRLNAYLKMLFGYKWGISIQQYVWFVKAGDKKIVLYDGTVIPLTENIVPKVLKAIDLYLKKYKRGNFNITKFREIIEGL